MSKFNRRIATVTLLLLAGFLAGGQNFVSGQTQSIRLRGVDGSTFNLADLRGKIVLLAFSGTWVPLASKELPALQKLADRYSARGVQFFWVSINSDKSGEKNFVSDADLTQFTARNGLKMRVLRDPELEAYRSLGLDAVPTIVLIDQNGKVIRRHVGLSPDQPGSYSGIMHDIDDLLK